MKKEFWFSEKVLPGEKRGGKILIKIKRRVFSKKSPFQKIEVFDSKSYGRMLILDGVVQLAKKDEFIYHEMLANCPLFSHPDPKRVLIIGGGDGGILREVLKHNVKRVILCEIDKEVLEVSKKYLSFVSKNSFKDKRVEIFYEPGQDFIKKYKNFFDVIILDVTDPSSLSFPLLGQKFTKDLILALRKRGIVAYQSGGTDSFFKWIKKLYWLYKNHFQSVKIFRFNVPSFLEAEWSFIMAGKNIELGKINLKVLEKRFKKIKANFRYYSPEIHYFSGILPNYLKEKLEK